MSRVAMHVGNHTHPAKFTPKRTQEALVRALMEDTLKRSPGAKPSVVRSETIKALQDIFEDKVASLITKDEAADLEETLAVLSDWSVVRNMIRSIKKYTHASSDLQMLLELKKKMVMPFVQSILFPGQSLNVDERPHIFKMSTTGPGSGLDLIRRMQPGGDLEKSWIMSDVMHRTLDDKWCTMSAHVYDHHYRGLCTIFTCELVSQDTLLLQTAWKVMRRICKDHGLSNVQFTGFMADNADVGWNAIRNKFWNGKVCPSRERSDSFHWAQSVQRVTTKYIHPDKRAEHKRLFDSLQDVGNFIVAFRIFEQLKDWWEKGNAIKGNMVGLVDCSVCPMGQLYSPEHGQG
ncbi:unnamed protein product [Calypogeia fissa]